MEPSQRTIPKWLQHLQENSWEIELLISGGAVFTLLQLPEPYLDFMRSAKVTSDLPGTAMILVMGMAGIKILTNGFILHLLLRSFWLAMVCLNYIYPQGIVAEKMKRAFPFRSRHTEGDLQDQIMQVDRLSGLVIFMTIISTLVLSGLVLGFIGVVFLLEELFHVYHLIPEIDDLLGSSMILYGLDLLLMGLLRRIPLLSWLLFPVFWLFDQVTLRSVYTRPLALFTSNVSKPRFYAGALVFGVFTGLTTYVPLARPMHWPRLFDARQYPDQLASSDKALVDWCYADLVEPEKRGVVYIPSHRISSNFLQVNLRYDRSMDFLLDHSHPDRSKRFLSDLIELSVDDSLYASTEWLETKEIGNSQMGLMAMVDIARLPNGPHKLVVQSRDLPHPKYKKVRSEMPHRVVIPFWKDVF